jgi:hypothetical protein
MFEVGMVLFRLQNYLEPVTLLESTFAVVVIESLE